MNTALLNNLVLLLVIVIISLLLVLEKEGQRVGATAPVQRGK